MHQGPGAEVRQNGFRLGVAVQHAALAAFFIVQYDGHGDPRLVRPAHFGWPRTVTLKIARIKPGGTHEPRPSLLCALIQSI
jgi:hypothetical protein